MTTASTLLLAGFGLLALTGFLVFAYVSWREQEPRATRVALAAACVVSAPFFGALFLPVGLRLAALGVLFLGLLAVAAMLVLQGGLPVGGGRPSRRVDERDTAFARARLEPGSHEYETYYAMHPRLKAVDDRCRALPGLYSLKAEKAEPFAFASAEASFALTEVLREHVEGPVAEVAHQETPEFMSDRVKEIAQYYGACAVGIAELRPHHLYSHIGRGTGTWGSPVELDHEWAITFAVEMDHRMVRSAPEASVIMESAREYVEAARIGLQLAALIRSLGYPARAHIDGNYQVIAPLVARDAGLGEIGRMGILMHPRLGPRVRLGVVTTDLPLVADPPGDDRTAVDFCTICKKCAENCPTACIPFGDREAVDGARRWKIDADACYRYWCVVGTDCARCMCVCPYSHPDNAAHNLVRWAIRRSGAARRALLWMDDLFYGRHPQPLP